jgi:hypothetical protein
MMLGRMEARPNISLQIRNIAWQGLGETVAWRLCFTFSARSIRLAPLSGGAYDLAALVLRRCYGKDHRERS